jgi:hypothetical protein
MPFDACSACRPFAGGIAWHVVHEVVGGGGGGGVQDCVRTGVPPVQPAGVRVATERVCWPLVGQVAGAQAVYVNPVQATTGGT